MFNNTSISQEVNNSNKFNFNINAVSGTLRKSHPRSKTSVEVLSKDNKIFDAERPQKFVKVETTYEKEYPFRSNSTSVFKDIIVLQTMLIGNDKALVEWVFEEEFEV